jgi:16S rRNA (adenine1518-N6/adenine1519-N6)-dimethyltransferase
MSSKGVHVARKRFGQNFLVDRAVIAAIVKAIAPQSDDVMIEIGPGLAALTDPLLEAREAVAGARRPLHAIELDRDLAARLQKRFANDRLIVHQADALSFDFASLAGANQSLRVVGNLPYNISTPLLFHLLEIADRIIDQHFMLQKEVVARMVASPGTSDFGRLSVMLQVRYDMESLFDVPPTAFDPPPKVTSAIVRMIPLPVSSLTIIDQRRFASLVMLAFSQRRKMLRNTLGAHAEAMEAVGIAPTARAEEIAPETYVALANHGQK